MTLSGPQPRLPLKHTHYGIDGVQLVFLVRVEVEAHSIEDLLKENLSGAVAQHCQNPNIRG